MPEQLFDKLEESDASKKKRLRLKELAKKVRTSVQSRFTKYFIADKNDIIYGYFIEFSGPSGAKIALDTSGFSDDTSVVRIRDGQELAFLRTYTIGFKRK